MEYGNNTVPFVSGVERLDHESHLPNFDVIFYELNKLESSSELLDLKTRLLKLQQCIQEQDPMSFLLENDSKNKNNTDVNLIQKS